jgi:hypothetical protein
MRERKGDWRREETVKVKELEVIIGRHQAPP